MIKRNFSFVLTNHGYVDIVKLKVNKFSRDVNKKDYKIAYVDDGSIKFTDDYGFESNMYDNACEYKGENGLDIITNDESLYYINENNSKEHRININSKILTSYTPNNKADLSNQTEVKLEIKNYNTGELDNIILFEKDFYDLILLYMCLSKKKKSLDASSNDCVILYLDDNYYRTDSIKEILINILGNDYFNLCYKGNKKPASIYIESKNLLHYIDNLDKTLDTVLSDENHRLLFCESMEYIAKTLEFYDEDYTDCSILYGNKLREYFNYIAAVLVTCGYVFFLRRMPNGKYKVIFKKGEYKSVTSKEISFKGMFVDIVMRDCYQIFNMEMNNWISNTSIRRSKPGYKNIKDYE